ARGHAWCAAGNSVARYVSLVATRLLQRVPSRRLPGTYAPTIVTAARGVVFAAPDLLADLQRVGSRVGTSGIRAGFAGGSSATPGQGACRSARAQHSGRQPGARSRDASRRAPRETRTAQSQGAGALSHPRKLARGLSVQ